MLFSINDNLHEVHDSNQHPRSRNSPLVPSFLLFERSFSKLAKRNLQDCDFGLNDFFFFCLSKANWIENKTRSAHQFVVLAPSTDSFTSTARFRSLNKFIWKFSILCFIPSTFMFLWNILGQRGNPFEIFKARSNGIKRSKKLLRSGLQVKVSSGVRRRRKIIKYSSKNLLVSDRSMKSEITRKVFFHFVYVGRDSDKLEAINKNFMHVLRASNHFP